ncbi:MULTISPECIES: amidase family protein [Cyanophyceae]|uniref:amidase family protein n=1 Tax=Cyanophyceae TaxID=3028117 RepID=UPI001682DE1D|nr:amidase family protein [Trichocoleus sp. FACHB-40]MBD2007053.1 amidase [Trichocoleus sp. FACHB-40]
MLKTIKRSAVILMTQAFVMGLLPISVLAATFELEEATIAEINRAFDAGALTAEELVQLYLNRIEAYEDSGPKLNSITTINPNALETAAALDLERQLYGPRSPLHGIPILLKDNIDTFDLPTSNGSVILKNSIPPDDAFITQALRDAGAIILGKAAMGEFAGGSYNTIDGQTLNPYNFNRNTGGSSSGSGAAVAANLSVLAIGTDTSTSVRGPASFNGIVGLRPTTGLISRDGIAPKNLTFDTAGPMARTVTDMALLLNVIAGVDPADPLTLESEGKIAEDYTNFLVKGSLKGARLGVSRDFFGGDPEIDALAEQAIAKLEELGAEIIDPVLFSPEFIDFFVRGQGPNIRTIADYRFKADWDAYLATLGPEIPKTVEEFIEIYETEVNQSPLPVENSVLDLLKRAAATSTNDPAYKNLIENVLPQATELKLALFDAYDLDALVFPYQTSFAPPINNPVYSVNDPNFVRSSIPSPATIAGYSSVGFPGIVVPMGFGSQGLPTAISFFGKPYEEGKLISYAYDYEQATKLRAPSPLVPSLPGERIEYEAVPEPGMIPALAVLGVSALGIKFIKRRKSQHQGQYETILPIAYEEAVCNQTIVCVDANRF